MNLAFLLTIRLVLIPGREREVNILAHASFNSNGPYFFSLALSHISSCYMTNLLITFLQHKSGVFLSSEFLSHYIFIPAQKHVSVQTHPSSEF